MIKAGTVLFLMCLVMWFLSSYGFGENGFGLVDPAESILTVQPKNASKQGELAQGQQVSLEAAEEIDLKDFNLIILDVNLPDGSGFDYLK